MPPPDSLWPLSQVYPLQSAAESVLSKRVKCLDGIAPNPVTSGYHGRIQLPENSFLGADAIVAIIFHFYPRLLDNE